MTSPLRDPDCGFEDSAPRALTEGRAGWQAGTRCRCRAPGDEIVFSKYGGTEIKVGSDDYLILRESDVLAKVTGDREPAGATA